MLRAILPFTGLAVLFGSALIGAVYNNHPAPQSPAPFTFAAVQDAVARQRCAHMVFRAVPEIASPTTQYEVWLKTESPAFRLQTSKGRWIGDKSGVRYLGKGLREYSLSKEAVTASFIRKEMLMPQFETGLDNAPVMHWKGKDIDSSAVIPFYCDDNGVHRVLWVNRQTHLPIRLDVQRGCTTTPPDSTASPGANQFYIIYLYGDETKACTVSPEETREATRSKCQQKSS